MNNMNRTCFGIEEPTICTKKAMNDVLMMFNGGDS